MSAKHPNAQLIEQFYSSFSQRDYAGMIACYALEAEFSDPVFTVKGKQVGAMWHMLCTAGKDLAVTFSDVQADDSRGRAHWEAHYTFSTGRKVHNVIDAEFVFQNGKIVRHQDRFNFWRWSSMALGPVASVLGWAPFFHNQVRRTVVARLDKFIAAHPEYQ